MKYITTLHAASIFGVNDSRIRQKYRANELPGVILNRELFITVDDHLVDESDIEPNTFITLEEIAEKHGKTPMTIRRWCMSGKIPAKKIGRNWFILREIPALK